MSGRSWNESVRQKSEMACDLWLIVICLIFLGVFIPLIIIYNNDDKTTTTTTTVVNPQPGSVGTTQLADGAVTVAKLDPSVLTRPHHWECVNASSELQDAVDWAQNEVNENSKGVLLHNVVTKHAGCRACDGTLMLYGDLDLWLDLGSAACTPTSHAQAVQDCAAVHAISNVAHPHSYLNMDMMHVGINCSTSGSRRRRALLQDIGSNLNRFY